MRLLSSLWDSKSIFRSMGTYMRPFSKLWDKKSRFESEET
jgi:hypothetical protein